jgi:hypothetical protein
MMQQKIEDILMWICVINLIALFVSIVHDGIVLHQHFHP